MPPFAPDTASGLRVLLALQRNGLSAFPERCLAEPVIRLPLLGGRLLVLANDGPTVAEMLQGRAGDYARMPAARRILGPVVGRGLLTSAGDHWRKQRRAMAPAFTPRALPMMAGHIARVADDFRVTLAASARPVLPVATLTTRPDHAPGFRLTARSRPN